MANLEFKNLDELYSRIKPALYSKVQEFKRKSIIYIKEQDIWNYLSRTYWRESESLSLSKMVSDILNLNENDIKKYLQKTENNETIREEDTLLWKTKN